MRLLLVKGRSYVHLQKTTTSDNKSGWFALHTRHQHESKVATALEFKGIDSFLPTYRVTSRWNDRTKLLAAPLFPGYVFASNFEGRRLDVLNTPGVAAIVSFAGAPAEVPAEEMEAIRRMIQCPSKIEPHEYLKSGDEVCVTHGPLAGLKGILIRKRDSLRLVVSIELLGRAAAVEIEAANLERLKGSGPRALPV